jgi:hypothetical protein
MLPNNAVLENAVAGAAYIGLASVKCTQQVLHLLVWLACCFRVHTAVFWAMSKTSNTKCTICDDGRQWRFEWYLCLSLKVGQQQHACLPGLLVIHAVPACPAAAAGLL